MIVAAVIIGAFVFSLFAIEGRSHREGETPVIEYEQDCRYWSDIGGEKAWIGEDCGK